MPFARRHWLLLWALLGALSWPWPAFAGPETPAPESTARAWLARIRTAAHVGNYQGTMVFSAPGYLSSSRVAHFAIGDQAYERVEPLDGKPRTMFRHNDVVHTVWPAVGVVVIERRVAPTTLLQLKDSVELRALDQYELRTEGEERIADRRAVVLLLAPRDEWRFAQRIWADRDTGLMLRADVIGHGAAVLESARFSEIEIGVRPKPELVTRPLRKLDGMRVIERIQTPTMLEAEGWSLARMPPGFRHVTAFKRPLEMPGHASGPAAPEVLQAIYSDGLTHVSVFVEPFDAVRHRQDLTAQFGATHTLTLRRGESWVTAMGDVPAATLRQFVDALERRRR